MKRILTTLAGVFLSVTAQAQDSLPFTVEPVTSFDQPWAMAFLPYGRLLVTEKRGTLFMVSQDGQKSRPTGNMPDVDYLSVDPFVDDDSVNQQIWTLGHRNPLGMAFDLDGQLWEIEHGPAGGDELNRIVRGGNYGYPVVSNGDHYDGRGIPDHDTRPEFIRPAVWWTPVISPGNMIVYKGELFSEWRGDALVAGLSSKAIIRIELDGENAREAERYPMGARIRAVVEDPGGTLWALEDEYEDSQGRLLRLVRGQ